MKLVERSNYPGWDNYPVYECKTSEAMIEVSSWCRKNSIEIFLVSSGWHGYQFQVRTLHDWFLLRWA
jgi:hypothetical protein